MNLKILLEYLHTRFELPLYMWWYLLLSQKRSEKKKKKKRKCLLKTKFVIYVQMYLVGRLRFTVFKRENLESHSHAIYKGYQNALLAISGHHGDKDMTKD